MYLFGPIDTDEQFCVEEESEGEVEEVETEEEVVDEVEEEDVHTSQA